MFSIHPHSRTRMKTLASAENDNTADGEVASGREIDHPGRQSENEVTKPIPAQATCEGLIFCNSQLASSFSEVKCNRARAKAGQYLHKVLLGKLRSQSVPSLENDVQPDIEDAGMSDDIVYGSEENSKEDWYKTWPDCIDKEKMKVGLKEGENSSVDDNIDKICANPNTPRSLKDIHLPLAYSPITKGLHLIRSAPQPNTNGFANVESSKKIDDKASLPELPENIDNSCSSPSDSDSNDRTKRRLIPGILSRCLSFARPNSMI
ncbi:unnamed protein product [Nesidiocoris tenuis]|uniref:Uncharacterized protein n=1 Tax=Nesidiocoris tenuis TaxID=355587 RepID=A0A6H5GD52_9HEMI|nr:unnamed protein product [Nesidiocoris tenuis]